MKKSIKKTITSAFLVFAMLCAFVPCVHAATIVASGECGAQGDNLTWTLDSEGTLTISGEGEMYKAYSDYEQPWRNYREQVTTVILGYGITKIGHSAFYGFSNLIDITIPDSVTSLAIGAFQNCSLLERIQFGRNITSIETLTGFNGCSSLKEIVIDAENEVYCSIDGVVYSKNKDILYKYPSGKKGDTYNILNDVTIIADGAFSESTLREITIPIGVTTIGQSNGWVFSRCGLLETVNISESVNTIHGGNFGGCSALQNINVNENNQVFSSIDGVLFNKDKTILQEYPEGRKGTYRIPEGVEHCDFSWHEGLAEVIIPDSMATINSYAFDSCTNLTSVAIPNSITSIDVGAFYDCNNLNDVYYSGSESQWKNIDIGWGNTSLTNATIHYNSKMPETFTSEDVTVMHSTPQGGSAVFTVAAKNTARAKELTRLKLYAAEYDGDILTKIDIGVNGMVTGDSMDITVPVPSGRYKIFLWDKLSPLMNVVEQLE